MIHPCGLKTQLRYKVIARRKKDNQIIEIGRTEYSNGGALIKMVNNNPSLHLPEVIDLAKTNVRSEGAILK